jgi:DNA-binding NarL/FixJ family response regulator
MRPRLLLADDHTLLRAGLQLLLEPEFALVGNVADGQALLTAAKELKPDLILLDISMPVLNGIEAARRLRKLLPSVKLIFVTMHSGADYLAEAFRAGASGYILKREAASKLRIAIREVIKGNHYVSRGLTSPERIPVHLTPRQREVLQLVAEGKNRKEISASLNISVNTVEFHRAALVRRLRLSTAADLRCYAIEHGIIAAKRSPISFAKAG